MKLIYSGVMTGKNGFTDALRQVFTQVVDIHGNQLHTIIGADIVFLQPQDKGIDIETLRNFKRNGAFIINWTGDARDITPAYCFDYAKVVDLTCFSNMRDVDTMRTAGYKSEFLQIGYDPAIYYPDTSVQKDIDIVFMGNTYGHFPLSGLRSEMVRELKRVYGDRFKSYGIGQPDGNFMGNQTGEADIYRRAKIGINLSHYDLPRYTSDRMFRMLGSGVCVLTHKYQSIDRDFDMRDIMMWKYFSELIFIINTLLRQEDGREIISKQGHQLALNEYTFLEMAKNIKKLYDQWK